jgi:hypothetical protein
MAPNFVRTFCLLGAIGYELCTFGEIECHIPIFIPANPNQNRKLPSFNNQLPFLKSNITFIQKSG